MKFASVFKYNDNHDEAGRFSTGDGVGFASPQTKEGLSFHDAQHEVGTAHHRDLAQKFRNVDSLLDINAKTSSSLGAWSDGAEDSTVTRFQHGVDYETLKTSMAMKGLLANQKAVVVFKRDGAGPNSMFYADVKGSDYAGLHAQLLKSGVEFHTIVPTSRGARVYSFDSSEDGAGAAPFAKFAGAHNVKARVIHGHGEFLGSWTSRDEGRQAYEKQIAAFFGQRRDRRGLKSRWARLHAHSTSTKQESHGEVDFLAPFICT